jgi:hypothetical protein
VPDYGLQAVQIGTAKPHRVLSNNLANAFLVQSVPSTRFLRAQSGEQFVILRGRLLMYCSGCHGAQIR